MHYSKNSELKIALLFVNIIANTECQHSQNSAVGLYNYFRDILMASFKCPNLQRAITRKN